jgi:flagellar assembly factor FliW
VEIQTRVFGTIEIDGNRVVTLTEPMAGFPELRRFAVLDPDPENPFKWLQSVDRAEVCFLIADPQAFFPGYKVGVAASRLADLHIEDPARAVVAVILTAGGDLVRTTANLLAPLFFNAEKGLARQVILEGSGHPVRAPLFEEKLAACQGG